MKVKNLLISGALSAIFVPVISKIIYQSALDTVQYSIADNLGQKQLNVFSSGSYKDIIFINVKEAYHNYYSYLFTYFPSLPGRFLIGYAIGKTGLIYDLISNLNQIHKIQTYSKWIVICLMLILEVLFTLLTWQLIPHDTKWSLLRYIKSSAFMAMGVFLCIFSCFAFSKE